MACQLCDKYGESIKYERGVAHQLCVYKGLSMGGVWPISCVCIKG